MLSSLVWVIAVTLLRQSCHLLSVAEYSLAEIQGNSTQMKKEEPSMKEVPGQCGHAGTMGTSKATWQLVTGTPGTRTMTSDGPVFFLAWPWALRI